MLVLSRKVGEKIHIGDEVTLSVTRIQGNRVTLAIDAPLTVKVVRGELEPHTPKTPAADAGRLASEERREASC